MKYKIDIIKYLRTLPIDETVTVGTLINLVNHVSDIEYEKEREKIEKEIKHIENDILWMENNQEKKLSQILNSTDK